LPDNNNQNQEPTGEEVEDSRVARLEALVAEKDQELAFKDSRISELEQAISERDNEVVTLNESLAELEGRLPELESGLSQAVTAYRALVIKSNPGVPEELVAGGSVAEIDDSLAGAQTLVDRVRQELEAEIAAARIPAGAPQRGTIDLSALSPREKIQYAVGERR
jgi:uncharacterized protein (DUF3084 family)